jgi:hypothetical protein
MDRLFNVAIEYLGRKKMDVFNQSCICLGTNGDFLVMDSAGKRIRFGAKNCRVIEIAAHVIVVEGYTDKPRHITAYCVYPNKETTP